jgi:hypothetical protein
LQQKKGQPVANNGLVFAVISIAKQPFAHPTLMKKLLLTPCAAFTMLLCPAQNLIVNAGAESMPRGTGWTIVSQGALTCLSAPTDNIINCTMKPDGSANYPYDHTTAASGGTVFFLGCSSYFQGPFEIYQVADISADAAMIDIGNEVYSFSGYMQTPVSNQTDQGRFIVDYLDASGNIIGPSYTSSWQSYFGGSGTGWHLYTSSRIAPVGTRSIKIRMQAQMYINQPAINVYFDDISLTKPFILPLSLLRFTGQLQNGLVQLQWQVANPAAYLQYKIERSSDGQNFYPVATIPALQAASFFTERPPAGSGQLFYRIGAYSTANKIDYSSIICIKAPNQHFTISPNPASTIINIGGFTQKGMLTLYNSSGTVVLTKPINSTWASINSSHLPAGIYRLQFTSTGYSSCQPLILLPH